MRRALAGCSAAAAVGGVHWDDWADALGEVPSLEGQVGLGACFVAVAAADAMEEHADYIEAGRRFSVQKVSFHWTQLV